MSSSHGAIQIAAHLAVVSRGDVAILTSLQREISLHELGQHLRHSLAVELRNARCGRMALRSGVAQCDALCRSEPRGRCGPVSRRLLGLVPNALLLWSLLRLAVLLGRGLLLGLRVLLCWGWALLVLLLGWLLARRRLLELLRRLLLCIMRWRLLLCVLRRRLLLLCVLRRRLLLLCILRWRRCPASLDLLLLPGRLLSPGRPRPGCRASSGLPTLLKLLRLLRLLSLRPAMQGKRLAVLAGLTRSRPFLGAKLAGSESGGRARSRILGVDGTTSA